MESNPLLEALSQSLGVPVKYYTQVRHLGIDQKPFDRCVVLCFSNHSLFLLSKDMQEVEGEILYANISRVVVNEGDFEGSITSRVIRLELTKQVPPKMTLMSVDIETTLKYLRCYWETDYTYRKHNIKFLKFVKEAMDLKKFSKYQHARTVTANLTAPPGGFFAEVIRDYIFFIPSFFSGKKTPGQYQGVLGSVRYSLTINIHLQVLLSQLTQDLKAKAEEVLNRDDFWVFQSQPFLKKCQIVPDHAAWNGWELELGFENHMASVIYLQRKFLPPFMDSGQEMWVLCEGKGDTRTLAAHIANFVHSAASSTKYYRSVLQQRCDTLIMDEEIAKFYREHLQINPQALKHAYMFIYSLCRLYQRSNPDNTRKLIINKIEKIMGKTDFEFFRKHVGQTPLEIMYNFETRKAEKYTDLGKWNWRNKVRRYLVFCLDGGLFPSAFSLQSLIDPVMSEAENTVIHGLLIDLLNIRKATFHRNPETHSKDLHEYLREILKSPQNEWTFNNRLMEAMLDTGYLKKELEGYGTLFPSILDYILRSHSFSFSLKMQVSSLVSMISDSNDFLLLSPLIETFIDLYRGNNKTLACNAARSLLAIANTKDSKRKLFEIRRTIYHNLQSFEQTLVFYSLKLLRQICFHAGRRQVISLEVIHLLEGLVVGPRISGAIYNAEVISATMQLLTKLAVDLSINEAICKNEAFFNAIAELHIGREDEGEIQTYKLIERLLSRNLKQKPQLADKLLVRLCSKILLVKHAPVLEARIALILFLVYNNGEGASQISEFRNAFEVLNSRSYLSEESQRTLSELRKYIEENI